MNLSGNRYAFEKHHRGRWITVAATDDLALLMKMLRDQYQHITVTAGWRVLDRVHDKVLTVSEQPTGSRRVE